MRADKLLKGTQDAEDIARLRSCARIVLKKLSSPKLGDEGFSLRKALLDMEAEFIEQALREEKGIVSRAAKRLGIRYQTLAAILNTRHKHLLHKRTPIKTRRRGIIK